MKKIINTRLLMSSLVISVLLGGCAGTPKVNENDPWEGWNRGVQSFNDDVDNAIVKPVSKSYLSVIPTFFNEAVSNFFSNINDIGVTANDLLQFKIEQGGMDARRFLINTTAGMGGFIDVAKMFDLPKHHEDFGQTLGYWGLPTGNYLVVPFLGSSSPRGIVGFLGDALLNPLTYTFVFAGSEIIFSTLNAGAKMVDINDTDTDLGSSEQMGDDVSFEHYELTKNAYLQRRKYLVNDGNVPDADQLQLADEVITDDESSTLIKANYGYETRHFQHMFISP